MPRKKGIFKLHQHEILGLLEQGIGYTEIAQILHENHGIKPTKQNLKQSHERYLKELPELKSVEAREGEPEKRRSKAAKVVLKLARKCPESTSKKVNSANMILELRARTKEIHLELIALLDSEEVSGRFSPSEVSLLRGWARVLLSLNPNTARDTFNICFGCDFMTYQGAMQDALEVISREQTDQKDEEFLRPSEEDEFLRSLSLKMDLAAEAEREIMVKELREYLEANPELK